LPVTETEVALHFSVESVSRNQVSRRNLVSETPTTLNGGATETEHLTEKIFSVCFRVILG